jgi:hypothetical protein
MFLLPLLLWWSPPKPTKIGQKTVNQNDDFVLITLDRSLVRADVVAAVAAVVVVVVVVEDKAVFNRIMTGQEFGSFVKLDQVSSHDNPH